MNLKRIGVVLTSLFGSSLAAAATPPYSTATTNELYISGSSSQDGVLLAAMRRICKVGTLTVYRRGQSAGDYTDYMDGNMWAFHCSANSEVALGLSKPNIVVYKNGDEDVSYGIEAVANGSTLHFLDIATIDLANCSAATTVAAVSPIGLDYIGLPSYDEKHCMQSSVVRTTEVGLSDVEPTLFKGSVAGIDQSVINNLTVSTLNQLIFGVPVTLGLYRALQEQQVANGTLLPNCLGDDTEACMPTLSKPQITSLYTGSLFTWDYLGLNNTSDPYNAVWVARWVDGSGPHMAAKTFFLNSPCAPNLADFVSHLDPTVATSPDACSRADPLNDGWSTVYQGKSSGKIIDCLIAHEAKGRWAIGILSTGGPLSPGGSGFDVGRSAKFRFVKIDGIPPTLFWAANGNYQYVMQGTMQWRGPQEAHPLSGDDLNLARVLLEYMGGLARASSIANINNSLVQVYGRAGLLVNPGVELPDSPITQDGTRLYPVSAFSRSGSGSANSCQPLQQVLPGSRTGTVRY